TRSASYWDFINRVRDDWGVNRTIPGSYMWFRPEQILVLPDDQLRRALARQRVGVASMWGGWVDPDRGERPPFIGLGTFVTSDALWASMGSAGLRWTAAPTGGRASPPVSGIGTPAC